MKHFKNSLILLILLMLTLPAFATSASSGSITMEFDPSTHDASQEAQLWTPYPLSDRDQLISKIKISGDFSESAVYSDQKYSTPMLYARWDKNSTSRKLSLSFDVVRQEVRRAGFPKKEAAWYPADYAMYLTPTSLGPIDGQVRFWPTR